LDLTDGQASLQLQTSHPGYFRLARHFLKRVHRLSDIGLPARRGLHFCGRDQCAVSQVPWRCGVHHCIQVHHLFESVDWFSLLQKGSYEYQTGLNPSFDIILG
jgi:hypothetical protein